MEYYTQSEAPEFHKKVYLLMMNLVDSSLPTGAMYCIAFVAIACPCTATHPPTVEISQICDGRLVLVPAVNRE